MISRQYRIFCQPKQLKTGIQRSLKENKIGLFKSYFGENCQNCQFPMLICFHVNSNKVHFSFFRENNANNDIFELEIPDSSDLLSKLSFHEFYN